MGSLIGSARNSVVSEGEDKEEAAMGKEEAAMGAEEARMIDRLG